MKDKILTALKSKYNGVDAKLLDRVADYLGKTVTDENTIGAAVDGAEPIITGLQAELDRRVNTFKTENDTLKAEVENLKKTQPPKPPDPQKPPKKDDDDTPAWAKALIESQDKITQELTQLKGEKLQKSLEDKLIGTLKQKEVAEDFYKVAVAGRTFKDEAEVDAFATTIEEGYKAHIQKLTDEGLAAGHARPVVVKPAGDKPSTLVTEMIAEKKDGKASGSDLVGKPL